MLKFCLNNYCFVKVQWNIDWCTTSITLNYTPNLAPRTQLNTAQSILRCQHVSNYSQNNQQAYNCKTHNMYVRFLHCRCLVPFEVWTNNVSVPPNMSDMNVFSTYTVSLVCGWWIHTVQWLEKSIFHIVLWKFT